MAKAQTLATMFGGMSTGIGAWYVVAPEHFLETIGAPPTTRRIALARMVGAQELAVGSALLMDGRAAPWLTTRLVGDVLHGVMLGIAWRSPDVDQSRMSLAWGAWAMITASDAAATLLAKQTERTGVADDEPTGSSERAAAVADGSIRGSVTVNSEPRAVYDYWRRLENLPRFMKHLERVEEYDGTRSHWVARAPLGAEVEWDAEITDDVPGERIAWSSTQGSQIWNAGEVTFQRAPGDRGTEVHVRLEYAPPGGPVGAAIARLLGEEPKNQIKGDLRRLKQVIETGEMIVSEAVAEGRSRRQRPARPLGRAA
jgi:uncharacterized membrane protein